MSFASLFLQFVTCLLILLILSFGEQRFLILMKSSLAIISLMELVFDVVSKKASCTWGGFHSWVSALVSCDLFSSSTCLLGSSSLIWIQEELLLFQSVHFFVFNLFSVQTKGWSGKFQTPYMKNRKPEVSQFSEFLKNLFFNWRIIALQNFAVFCQGLAWSSVNFYVCIRLNIHSHHPDKVVECSSTWECLLWPFSG